MRNFKVFCFGADATTAATLPAKLKSILVNKGYSSEAEINIDEKVFHRKDIYFQPEGYAETSACKLAALNPDRPAYTFTVSLSDLSDEFFTTGSDGKKQGKNLFFGINKDTLSEDLVKEINSTDAKYRKYAADNGFNNAFWANGSYNFTGMKLTDNNIRFLRLDLGEKFIFVVEEVEAKVSKQKYLVIREFWGVTFTKAAKGGQGATNNGDASALFGAPSADEIANKGLVANNSAPEPSINEMREALIKKYSLADVSVLDDAGIRTNYAALA